MKGVKEIQINDVTIRRQKEEIEHNKPEKTPLQTAAYAEQQSNQDMEIPLQEKGSINYVTVVMG